MAFQIERILIRQIRMPLVHFFETSFSRTYARDIVLVEVMSDGLSGWGEVTAGENPFYNEEWTASIWPLLTNYIAPRILHHSFESANDIFDRTAHIRGHFMTRGGVEAAIWDLESRRANVSLAQFIGGKARTEIPCGVSIGIQDSVTQLLEKIATELAAGYQRIKIKIKPGWDLDVVRQVRDKFPNILLMAGDSTKCAEDSSQNVTVEWAAVARATCLQLSRFVAGSPQLTTMRWAFDDNSNARQPA